MRQSRCVLMLGMTALQSLAHITVEVASSFGLKNFSVMIRTQHFCDSIVAFMISLIHLASHSPPF